MRHGIGAVLAGLLALLCVSDQTFAGKVGSEFRVNTATRFDQWRPSVASLSDGSFVVVWMTQSPDGRSDVRGQLFNAASQPFGSELRITTRGYERDPDVAALANGGFVVTWQSERLNPVDPHVSDGFDLYVQRYDALGAPVGGRTWVNDSTAVSNQAPSVVGLKTVADRYVVTWSSYDTDGSGWNIYARYYNGARAVGSAFRVNTYTDDAQDSPTAVALSNGGFVILWGSEGQNVSGAGLYGQRYGPLAKAVGKEFRINSLKLRYRRGASLAAHADGGFVAAWDRNSNIRAQRYTDSGKRLSEEFLVNTNTAGHQGSATVATLTDGGFVVIWVTHNQDATSWYDIYGQRYNAAGEPVGGEFQVNTHVPGEQFHPSVAALPNGRFVVVWTSNDQNGSDYDYDVQGQLFEP